MASQAFVPLLISRSKRKWEANVASVLFGVVFVSLLAQVSIPLAWTPVPITGQTFGVTLMALLWGRSRAVAALLGYLLIGSLGLPVFALGKAGLVLGPTTGYLIGMVFSATLIGSIADSGWSSSFLTSFVTAVLGSFLVFSFGVLVLALYLPAESLLAAGVLPFLPGDLIKNLLAAWFATSFRSVFKNPS